MRFKLTLEYDGSNYSGWQKQKNAKTVQGTLIQTITRVLAETPGGRFEDLQGAGRTDTGVHALGQVAHLECETSLRPKVLLRAIDAELPPSIALRALEPVDPRFHARHWASSRQYLYRISTRRNVFEKKYTCWVKEPLDLEAMQAALPLVLGHHDFVSFSRKPQKETSTEVVVEDVQMQTPEDLILLRIRASHFLWGMVRIWVGALLEIGKGQLTQADLLAALKNYQPELKSHGAPAAGLFLEKIDYAPRH